MPSSIQLKIDGIDIELIPYSGLQNCYTVQLDNSVLIRMNALDTQESLFEFLHLIKHLHNPKKPLRVVSYQLNHPEVEWDVIQRQHRKINQLNQQLLAGTIAHLTIPLEKLFYEESVIYRSEFIAKTVLKLTQLINTEAWVTYCRWLNEDIEEVLRTFQPEDTEEYQLQGLLEDFTHEVRSGLLESTMRQISAVLTELERENADSLSLEKKLVAAREHLKANLQIQKSILENIVKSIVAIESTHPELSSLKRKTNLLYQAMDPSLNWVQQMLILQLLDEKLGVIAAFNCDSGLERTHAAFNLRLALAALRKKYTIETLVDLIVRWPEKNQTMPALLLRKYFLMNIVELSISDKAKRKKKVIPLHVKIHPDLVGLLPSSTQDYAYLISFFL